MDAKNERLWTIFKIFFKISAVSVGGGLTMLPLMTEEFVEKRDWLTEKDMVDVVAVMQSMPGIIAINMGILIGFRVAGFLGAVVAAVAVTLPPFFVIIIVAALVTRLAGSETVNHIFLGVRAAVCALILVSVIKLGKQVMKTPFEVIMTVIGFVSLVFFEVNAIWLIVFAAVAGVVVSVLHYLRMRKAMSSGEGDEL